MAHIIDLKRPVGETDMKNMKWLILGLAVMTLLALYLNRERLFTKAGDEEAEKYFGDADFVYTETDRKAEYFASARYNREKKRTEATEALNDIIQSALATAENKSLAYEEIRQYAFSETCENAIESLIAAKGFGECIAFVGRDSASVVVSEDRLTQAQAAQITDIVVSQTGYSASDVTVIEYKAGDEAPAEANDGVQNE